MSFCLRTLMKASLGTSTLPISRIFFLPSACFFRSFILRVMSPPYCQHRHRVYAVVMHLNTLLIRQFCTYTFSKNIFSVCLNPEREEDWMKTSGHIYTFINAYTTMNASFMKPFNVNRLTFLLQLSCFRWLLVQRSQTFVLEWHLWAAHTWISRCCTPGSCKDKYHQNHPAGTFLRKSVIISAMHYKSHHHLY